MVHQNSTVFRTASKGQDDFPKAKTASLGGYGANEPRHGNCYITQEFKIWIHVFR